MLSPFDDPGVNRYSLNELYSQMVSYLADGSPIRSEEAVNQTEGGVHYCTMRCTPETCPYNRTAPISCPYTPPLAL